MRRFLFIMMTVSLLAGVAACSARSGKLKAADAETPRAVPTLTPTPAPTPTIDRGVLWRPVVDRAVLTNREVSGASAKDEVFTAVYTMPCGVASTHTRWAERAWSYVTDNAGFLTHSVAAYDPELGAAAVAEVRSALKSCKTWSSPEGLKMTVMGEFAADRPSGVDAWAPYCYQLTYLSGPKANDSIVICEVVASRGHLMTKVGLFDTTLSRAQSALRKVAPLAAASLSRAVPTA